MSVPIRSLGVAAALVLIAACGDVAARDLPVAAPAMPGQPPGTVVVDAGADLAQAVRQVQDAITANGGTVAAVVDHTADARGVRVDIAPSVLVIGGPPAAQVPLVRADQRAGASLPQHYLLSQPPGGPVTLTYNSADYVAAVSGVVAADASTPLRESTAAVVARAAPDAGVTMAAPLLGVTPANYLLSLFGSADVPVTVERLRRNADRGASRSLGVTDLTVGSAGPGPPPRPTTVVFVSVPEAEAPLLAVTPSLGLDLPLPFVVWLDDQDRTQIGYPDVRRLAARHGVPADDPNVVRLVAAADRLARLAAGILQ